MESLGQTFTEINEIYNNKKEGSKLTSEEILDIERYSKNRNVNVYIITNNLRWEYPQSENAGTEYYGTEYFRIFELLQDYIFNGSNPEVKSKVLISKTNKFSIYKLYDAHMKSNYIDLIGNLDNNYIIYMRSNFESIQESAVIANKFLSYVGIIAIIVGTAIMFYISKRFTKPILQLAGIAKQMSDLDFDVKYEVTSQDEIGELGCSINTLSEKLEKTISELKSAYNELLSDIQDKIQIDEMRKEFLSNVSHELKTPIALIQGYAEGLKENINEDEESRNFYCDVIMDEAKKMNELVKKIISLNQIEFGNAQLTFERFDLVTLIKSVLNSTEILFQQYCRLLQ
jgi:signal transduction histidine kinase